MNCRSVLRWVLDVETMNVNDWPRGIHRHLKRCPACALLARDLYKLEEAWRKAPVPPECAKSKAAFLEKLADPLKSKEFEIPDAIYAPDQPISAATISSAEVAARSSSSVEIPKPKRRSTPKSQRREYRPPDVWTPLRWLPFVVIVLFAIGLVLFMFLVRPNPAQASAETFDRVLDWTIRMISATDAQDRHLLLSDSEPGLRIQVSRAAFTPDERQLAEDLLNTVRQIAFSTDPLSDAESAFAVQSKLLAHTAMVERSGTAKDLERWGGRYARFTESAAAPLKVRLDKSMAPGVKAKTGKEIKSGMELSRRLRYETILSRAPEFTQRDLHYKFATYGSKK